MSTVLIFLFVCVLILALVFVMFMILKSTVNKINAQTKSYFVDKLQEYDYLIDEKETKLNQIDKKLKDKELKNNEGNVASLPQNNYEFDYNIINLLKETKYQDKNIFELNRKLETEFNIDYNKLISIFLSIPVNIENYEFCMDLRNKFSPDKIYELKLLPNDLLEEKLKSYLDSKEYQIYEIYKSLNNKASIEGFIDYITELLDLNNPYITIYVGNKQDNYDNLSKYIKTKYAKDIYKGIRIIYKNKIYDYSLNERNV